MLIMGFDSSAKGASVALLKDGEILASSFQNSGLTHSCTLLPMAEDMLKNVGLKMTDVDLFAVSKGPGSFTGIRIGVSCVKGLAFALEKEVCGVSTLEAMAQNGNYVNQGEVICCVMDARRQQFYNALFEKKGDTLVRICADRAISAEELVQDVKKLGKSIIIVGDGAKLCYNIMYTEGLNCALAPDMVLHQNAIGVCLVAKDKQGESVHDLLPVYLRLSQAERERQERVFGK